jgi:uncharacterized protein YjbJ (UPF0337 family)
MDWNHIEGKWLELTDHVKWQWSKLSEGDLSEIAGNKGHLVSKLQHRYGVLAGDAETQIDKWLAKTNPGKYGRPS